MFTDSNGNEVFDSFLTAFNEQTPQSLREFMTIVAQKKEFAGAATQTHKGRVVVVFPDTPKLGIKDLVEHCKKSVTEKNSHHIIFIVIDSLTPFANQKGQGLTETGMRIEDFMEQDMLYNRTKHKDVPVHTALKPQQVGALIRRYKLKSSIGSLPQLPTTDAIAKFYGFRKGQIVQIERVSQTGGKTYYFRLVV